MRRLLLALASAAALVAAPSLAAEQQDHSAHPDGAGAAKGSPPKQASGSPSASMMDQCRSMMGANALGMQRQGAPAPQGQGGSRAGAAGVGAGMMSSGPMDEMHRSCMDMMQQAETSRGGANAPSAPAPR